MPSVRMAADRAVKVEVDVEGMVALIREAGTGRFIEAMLDFCRKCVGADFVSILAYSRTAIRPLSELRPQRRRRMPATQRSPTCGILPRR
jgi:hypothetical protein